MQRVRYFGMLLALALVLGGCVVGTPTATVAEPTPATTGGVDVSAAAEGEMAGFTQPMDATPDLDGNLIYFVATSDDGPGVFSVVAIGSGTITPVAVGAPFVAPAALVVGSDNQTLYVADPQAGQIFTVTADGTASPLAGTEGTDPNNLDIVAEDGADVLYFSGTNPETGQPALLRIAAAGGDAAEVLLEGEPLVYPDGVAVAQGGVVYLADRADPATNQGAVYRIADGAAEKVLSAYTPGAPLGIALTLDESTLLVSSLSGEGGTSQVVLLNTATLETTIFNQVIGANKSSGGVHRARNADIYAWCGVTAGTAGGGVIYRISLVP